MDEVVFAYDYSIPAGYYDLAKLHPDEGNERRDLDGFSCCESDVFSTCNMAARRNPNENGYLIVPKEMTLPGGIFREAS